MFCPIKPEMGNRVNYGVLFDPIKEVYAIHDYWINTYEVKCPNANGMWYFQIHCESENKSKGTADQICAYYQAAFRGINEMRQEYGCLMNHTMTQLMQALPPKPPNYRQSARARRKLFGFIGQLLHTLFGTATEKDVRLASSHVEALEKKSQTMAATLANVTHDLSSFMTLSSDRMNNMKQQVIDEHNVLENLSQLVQEVSINSQYRERLIMLAIKELYNTRNYQTALADFWRAPKIYYRTNCPCILYHTVKFVRRLTKSSMN